MGVNKGYLCEFFSWGVWIYYGFDVEFLVLFRIELGVF